MAKGKTGATVRRYVGPDYPDGTKLHAWGRSHDPKRWTPEEVEMWIRIDARLGSWFTTVADDEAAPVADGV